jgi:3-oxoacyl-[acyl-carrier protein] reductase
MNRREDSQSKIVVLTGAFRGIGNLLFKHLCTSWTVWPICRTAEQTEHLRRSKHITATGTRWFHGDLREPGTTGKIAAECRIHNVKPYGIIHCSGPIHYSARSIPDWDIWEDQFRDNVSGAVHLIRTLPDLMNTGRIILFGFSGIDTRRGFKTISAYAAAKNAIAVLARSAAKTLGPDGITVNVISPGVFLTETGRIPSKGKEMLRSIPLARFGQSPDICGVIDWLLSPASGYVTGQVIKVSGGLHIS